MNDLPEDLAHPRGQNSSDIASIVVGVFLLFVAAALVAWVVIS